jgi:hypothetical protein
MIKAAAPLTPRTVLGNQRHARKLSIEEAGAALVALLSGVRVIPSRGELRKIAKAVHGRRARRGSPLQSKEVAHG